MIRPRKQFTYLLVVLALLMGATLDRAAGRGGETVIYLPALFTPRTIQVTGTGDTVAADGACTLREAVQAANTNTTVHECLHDGKALRDVITFDLGPFATRIDVIGQPIAIESDLTIRGMGQDYLTMSGNHSNGILTISTIAPAVVVVEITDLTLEDGKAFAGAAIYSENAELTIRNVSFIENNATNDGGAIASAHHSLTIVNSYFQANLTGSKGGAIASGSELTVIDTTFIHNQAAYVGGAIHISSPGSANLIQRSHFEDNQAFDEGGAIANFATTPLVIVDSTMIRNIGVDKGGAIFAYDAVTLVNSTLDGNMSGEGGAIYLFYGAATVANTTLSNNSAGDGGAFYLYGSTQFPAHLTLINATLAGNFTPVPGKGGGLYNRYSQVTVQNSILANGLGGDCFLESGVVTAVGPNLAGDSSCPGFTIPNGNAGLGPLQSNGGPTPTHALNADSDAIDAGDNAICAAAPIANLDQRGLPRPRDGDGDGTPICDLGAFENDSP